VINVGRRARQRGIPDDDLPVRRIDEADAQPPYVGQPLGSRSPLRIHADQELLSREAEPDRLEQPLRDQRHRPALVAADVARGVDPLEVGRVPVHLDVQEAVRLVVDRPVRGRLRNRREENAGRVAIEQGENVAQVLTEQVVE
jgi:hypothetical protein